MDNSDFKTFRNEKNTPTSSNQAFGYTVGISILLLDWFVLGDINRNMSFGLKIGAAGLIVAAFFIPTALSKFNKYWQNFGIILGRIITPIVLGFLFFIIITPLGLFLRRSGKLQYDFNFRSEKESDWIEREQNSQSRERIKNQF
jgi:hypothetical protein